MKYSKRHKVSIDLIPVDTSLFNSGYNQSVPIYNLYYQFDDNKERIYGVICWIADVEEPILLEINADIPIIVRLALMDLFKEELEVDLKKFIAFNKNKEQLEKIFKL